METHEVETQYGDGTCFGNPSQDWATIMFVKIVGVCLWLFFMCGLGRRSILFPVSTFFRSMFMTGFEFHEVNFFCCCIFSNGYLIYFKATTCIKL